MFRKRKKIERFWEILPGLQFWSVFFGAILLSFYKPVWAAVFIICFDVYWVLKAMNVAVHLMSAYKKFTVCVKIDWLGFVRKLEKPEELKNLFTESYSRSQGKEKSFYAGELKKIQAYTQKNEPVKNFLDIFHLVLIPFVDEDFEVLDFNLCTVSGSEYPKNRMIVVLASEGRAGEKAQKTARLIEQKYSGSFYKFFVTTHPDGLEGEIKGKSANAAWAIQSILPELEKLKIQPDQVLVSNFDSDTIVHPQYFAKVTYEFLLAKKPYQTSYQPIAIYNNNIWDTPALIRVVSVSNSFWQFTESSRPDRLRTFSSHTMTLKALLDIGLWKKDIVNEDGFVYWQCYLHYNGDYKVQPLFIPISLDTCLASTTWQTLKNQYKQKRRWAYNVEYYPHLIPKLLQLKAPRFDKLYKLFQYVEGNFNWATASIMISTLGWLPLFVGGNDFKNSVIALNLPFITKTLMNVALIFLIFSVYINTILLPPKPKKYGKFRSISMYLQWFLVPVASVVFGSVPAVEAQTRLMLGKYLEFWVTPKTRKGKNTAMEMKEMQTTTSY